MILEWPDFLGLDGMLAEWAGRSRKSHRLSAPPRLSHARPHLDRRLDRETSVPPSYPESWLMTMVVTSLTNPELMPAPERGWRSYLGADLAICAPRDAVPRVENPSTLYTVATQ